MFSIKKLILDLSQLGHIQPMPAKDFKKMWSKPKRSAPVEWWYLGSDNYYHYMAERWGMSRKAWKIQIAELQFTGVDLHYPEVGDDTKVGVILGEGHLPFNHKYNK